jgi:hypothetical protein
MIGRGKPKNSKRNLLQGHFVHNVSHLSSGEKSASSRLSYGTANNVLKSQITAFKNTCTPN